MIKVNIREKAAKLLGINDLSKIAIDSAGYKVKFVSNSVDLVSGKNAELKEEGVVSPGQYVLIYADRGEEAYTPHRGTFFLTYNPELAKYGLISHVGAMTAGDLSGLHIAFNCFKKVDLKELEYLIGVYVND